MNHARARIALAAGLTVAVFVATACAHTKVTGLAPVRPELFDHSGRVQPGAYGAGYSPDGTKLAVKSGDGIGVVTSGGKVGLLTPPGSHAVEYAWMPAGSALLIAEGPAATGQLDVLRLDGSDLGRVPLSPALAIGSGYGMAVAPDGAQAVAVTEDLAALGGPERLSLVHIDLATGVTAPVGIRSVRGPAYVDASHVLVTELSTKGDRAEVITLATGARHVVSVAGEPADALGVVRTGMVWLVYATDRAVWAVPAAGGARRRLARVPKDATAVAVDPFGTQAVLAERNGDVEQLRAISLCCLPSPGGSRG